MEEIELSQREQNTLDDIEARLRRDRRFDRAMAGSLRRRRRSRLPALVTALAFVSLGLLIGGIRTSDPAVIWAFAGVWPLTLVGACCLLCRWAAGSRHDGPRKPLL
ncbi:DUF3040 domain-containing protein [Streptomyces sp. NPDC001691]|uniref:DUF3040 domain-containing protein n=1 Tax=unclassified Streptomyces TaxID=2593676 RepID=UPI000DEA8B19|nr:DUF3040 domain-containing protein [Streptomyces sp. SDr-06]RCH64979.1 DUF3040 domain-containing protein [Streptomyces sp. SDr-06]